MLTTNHRKTFLLGAVLAAYLLLFAPFWKPVVLGFLLASASQPLVRRVRGYWPGHPQLAAWGIWGLLTLILVGLVVAMGWNAYSLATQIMGDPESVAGYSERLNGIKSSVLGWMREIPMLESGSALRQVEQGLDAAALSARDAALAFGRTALVETPVFLLDVFIFFVAWAAFLLVGPSFSRVIGWFTKDEVEAERRYYDFEETCWLSLGSVFLTAAVQAVIITVGASMSGFGSLMLIGLVTFIFAMVPVLGAGVAGTLLALGAFAEGNSQGGTIMLAFALFAGVTDNLMVAYLFSRAAKSNPLISLISFLGGIALFGFAGLFIAPVLEQLVMKEIAPSQERHLTPAAWRESWRKLKAYFADRTVPGAR
ncbi:MAG: AI-2E family transporter [Bdellovibrionaceae bacterium]|nr:AI-2E family transporter [Pseudobdellovibrionaceae bacterium]